MFLRKTWGDMVNTAGIGPSDLQILDDEKFFHGLKKREKGGPSRNFGDLYVSNVWTGNVDEVVAKILSSDAIQIAYRNFLLRAYEVIKSFIPKNPSKVGEAHYDIDFKLYELMLGKFLKYTAPYWFDEYGEFDLDKAQMLCMEMICRGAQLSEGQKVLEVGFGYGTLANYMISNYGVDVTGLTISKGQMNIADRIIDHHGNTTKAHFYNLDWKKLYNTQEFEDNYKGKFDRIVSIEMIEAVSTKDLPMFFRFLYECLNDDGILFIQAINSDRYETSTDGFIDTYIFPDGVVPQEQNMINQARKAGFKDFRVDNTLGNPYDKALMKWWDNVRDNEEEIMSKCNDPFKSSFPYGEVENPMVKIFEYYLRSCAGSFRVGYNRDGHFVFYKGGNTKAGIIIPTREEVGKILNTKDWGEIQEAIGKGKQF